MRRIGILGGTFDPVHRTHIRLAELAGEQFNLEEVWLMPSGDPPHKAERRITPGSERLHMLELAAEGHAGLRVSSFELEREGRIYTADTLALLTECYPEVEWFFILGGDSLMYMEKWYHPERIFRYATILATVRNGAGMEELLEKRLALQEQFPGARIEFVHMKADTLSSSRVRELLEKSDRTAREEALLTEALDEKEYRYIKDKGLYQA